MYIKRNLDAFRYLGMDFDLPSTGARAHTVLLQKSKDKLLHFPTVKINYIKFKLMPIILATAACSNLTLADYRELDKPFSQEF